MTGLDKPHHALPCGAPVVDGYRIGREPPSEAVDLHDRAPGCDHVGQVRGTLKRCRRHNEAVDLLLHQQLNRLTLALDALVTVRDDRAEPATPGNVGDAAHGARVEGVLDVSRNDADGLGLAGDQSPGEAVRSIVELIRRLPHPGTKLIARIPVAPEHPPSRRGAHPGALGHLDDGDAVGAFRGHSATLSPDQYSTFHM